jgi:hypothetical protein
MLSNGKLDSTGPNSTSNRGMNRILKVDDYLLIYIRARITDVNVCQKGQSLEWVVFYGFMEIFMIFDGLTA